MDPVTTEILVLGAGPGGYTAAFYAADKGKKVTLVEQNRNDWTARMDVEANDRRIPGNVNAKAWMKLTPREDNQTDLAIHTEASILGKLGQFGQAVMKKKADQIVGEFARNMSAKLAEPVPAAAKAPVGG